MKLRLTSRIALSFVLLATVLLAVVGVLSYRSASDTLKAAAISEMFAAAVEKEAALDTWLEERLADIGRIANLADVVEKAANLIAVAPDSDEARVAHAVLLRELEPRLMGPHSGYIELFVMEPESGKVVASTSPTEEGKSKLGHRYFDNGKTNLYLQAPYRSPDMAGPAMAIAIPLRATNGRVAAVLAARLDLAELNSIAQRRTGLHLTEDSFLFNAEQFPVTQPRFFNEPVVLRRPLDTDAVRRCAAGNSGVVLTKDYRGVPSIAVYRWNAKRRLGLIVKVDQAEALAPARAFGWTVVLISGLALLATVGISLLLSRTITQPLRVLHSSVRRFGEGNTAEPFPESSGDEIGLLAGEFNQMAARVAERTSELAKTNEALLAENTERKRAAEALRQSEEQFRAMFDLASVGIAQADPHTGQWLRVNKKMCEITGYSAGELLQLRVPDITHPEDRQFDREAFDRVVRGEAPDYRMEKRYIRKDGALAWVNVNMTVIRDAAGRPMRTVAAIEDVTERKRAEEALHASQQIIEGILNAIPVRIFWKDRNLVFMGCNAVLAHDAGFADPKDIIGKDDYQMGWGDQAELYRGDDRQVIESGCPKLLIEEPQRTPQGNTTTILTSKVPLRSSNGEIIGVLGTYMDITERKQSEEALRQRVKLQDQLARTAATVPGMIYSLLMRPDGSTRMPYVSGALSEIFDLQPQDVIEDATPVFSLIHPDDIGHLQATMAESARTLNPWRDDFRVCRTRLGEIWVEGHSVPQREPDGSILWHGFVQNITERKRTEASMQDMHKQLLDASRQAGMAEIATNVLHNVGNVLNSVNISTGLIVQSVKKSRASSLARVVVLLQEHTQDLGAFITQDSRGKHVPAHLAQLAEHLQAEQEANVRELELLRRNVDHVKEIVAMQQNYAAFGGVQELVNVVNLVEDSLRMNEGALNRHEVEVIREFEDVPPLNVEKHKILQILVNLLRNAKYACDDSQRADKRLTVRVANGGSRIKVSVIDNGVGIPPENLTRIFNYGFTTRKGGHGFGLHSAALAATELGGSLTVHSGGPGQGATFTLELPQSQPAENTAAGNGQA